MSLPIAIFSLNQWALDFEGNTKRIIESIDLAKEAGAAYRAGPELELCGYSLEDAFYEEDTIFHSWACLLRIAEHSANLNMLVDIGMPVRNGALYNCRVILYKGRILCIRAKTSLARDGIYREPRHFTPWDIKSGVTAFKLPYTISKKLKQDFVPFGANFILELGIPQSHDTFKIGWDICQELWDPVNVSSDLYQNFGCHIIFNGSGSYWEIRKLHTVLDMVKGISLRGGACYAFSNSVGCDGQRFVFFGRSCIYDKGKLVAITPTAGRSIFKEIQMITYNVSIKDINEYRAQMGIKFTRPEGENSVWNLSNSTKEVTSISSSCTRLYLEFEFPMRDCPIYTGLSDHITWQEEIDHYVPLWLWDYLRKSKMTGFMLPLSGGLDSSSVAILIYRLSWWLSLNIMENNEPNVADYFQEVHKMKKTEMGWLKNEKNICGKILKCCYLSTKYSSEATLKRAELLCEAIGVKLTILSLQDVYDEFKHSLGTTESNEVSLLDQNLQARLRMTATYYLSGGNRLVLAAGNVDEALMGYLTKYDCSSADLNPIGGLCKTDLKDYLGYLSKDYVFCGSESKIKLKKVVEDIIAAPPSAELTGAEQRDEDEIGLTYREISVLGKVRRGEYGCNGPKGAFEVVWRNRSKEFFRYNIRCLQLDGLDSTKAGELARVIKLFYQRYARNRHKLTVLTPALHAETYSPDDNRFDHRQFLYPSFTEQFKCIDEMVKEISNDCPIQGSSKRMKME